jgi:hypothetical protein
MHLFIYVVRGDVSCFKSDSLFAPKALIDRIGHLQFLFRHEVVPRYKLLLKYKKTRFSLVDNTARGLTVMITAYLINVS